MVLVDENGRDVFSGKNIDETNHLSGNNNSDIELSSEEVLENTKYFMQECGMILDGTKKEAYDFGEQKSRSEDFNLFA